MTQTQLQQQVERDVRDIMNTAMTDAEKTRELVRLIEQHREHAAGKAMTEGFVFSHAKFGDRA